MPTGYAWVRKGQRKLVDHHCPQGRRVNAVAALCALRERLVFECRGKSDGRYDGAAHLAFVRRVKREASPDRPCVIVLDNYSVHRCGIVKGETLALASEDIAFFFLPAYCPWLNEIEPLWRQVKYQDLPDRSHETEAALQAAVEAALRGRDEAMKISDTQLPASA